MELLEETLKMLRETSTPFKQIAEEADVSMRWLYMFANESYNDYGIIRVQRVHDILATH